MAKKILVLMASPRKQGNTDRLADAFIQGAKSQGHIVQKVCVSDQKENPCIGCKFCETHQGECVQNDGMQEIREAYEKADVVVMASPVYFHSISAQLKIIIDRLYAAGSYKNFEYEKKESVLLMTCMDNSDSIFDQAISYYHTLIRKAFPWKNRGEVCVNGLSGDKDSIEGNLALEYARKLGSTI